MAKSLARLKDQIAKLQKEADSLQAGVIARIKREIAQHGLTAEHLFGPTRRDTASTTSAAKPGKSKGAAKEAKYADGQGNSWHGIGKRPQWIHAALDAGHALADFLVGAGKSQPAKKATTTAAKATRKKAVKKKPATPTKKAAAAPAKRAKTATAVAAKKAAPKRTKAKSAKAEEAAVAAT